MKRITKNTLITFYHHIYYGKNLDLSGYSLKQIEKIYKIYSEFNQTLIESTKKIDKLSSLLIEEIRQRKINQILENK